MQYSPRRCRLDVSRLRRPPGSLDYCEVVFLHMPHSWDLQVYNTQRILSKFDAVILYLIKSIFRYVDCVSSRLSLSSRPVTWKSDNLDYGLWWLWYRVYATRKLHHEDRDA